METPAAGRYESQVLDRRSGTVALFERGDRGKQAVAISSLGLEDPALRETLGDEELYEQLLEDAELLDEMVDVFCDSGSSAVFPTPVVYTVGYLLVVFSHGQSVLPQAAP